MYEAYSSLLITFGRENIAGLDFAMFSQDINKFSYAKRFGDDNTQTRKKI
jgi:hypothetical protein